MRRKVVSRLHKGGPGGSDWTVCALECGHTRSFRGDTWGKPTEVECWDCPKDRTVDNNVTPK